MSNITEKVIVETLWKMLQTQSLDTITVKSLVEECGINRKTFYNHFSGLPDLLSEYTGQAIAAVAGEAIYPENWEIGMLSIFQWLKQNRVIVRNVYASRYYVEIRQLLLPAINSVIQKNLDRAVEIFNETNHCRLELTQQENSLISRYYVNTVLSFTEEWVETGMRGDPAEYIDTMSLLIHDNMYPLFDRIQERRIKQGASS